MRHNSKFYMVKVILLATVIMMFIMSVTTWLEDPYRVEIAETPIEVERTSVRAEEEKRVDDLPKHPPKLLIQNKYGGILLNKLTHFKDNLDKQVMLYKMSNDEKQDYMKENFVLHAHHTPHKFRKGAKRHFQKYRGASHIPDYEDTDESNEDEDNNMYDADHDKDEDDENYDHEEKQVHTKKHSNHHKRMNSHHKIKTEQDNHFEKSSVRFKKDSKYGAQKKGIDGHKIDTNKGIVSEKNGDMISKHSTQASEKDHEDESKTDNAKTQDAEPEFVKEVHVDTKSSVKKHRVSLKKKEKEIQKLKKSIDTEIETGKDSSSVQ